MVGWGDRENLQSAVELVRHGIPGGGDTGAFMDVEQEGVAFGHEGDGDVIGGGKTAERGWGKDGTGAFDAGGHGEKLEGAVVLG